MHIVCLSDTHLRRPSAIPEGDLLVHAGDLTGIGTYMTFASEIAWLSTLKPKFKHGIIFVPGNHDIGLDQELVSRDWLKWSLNRYHSYRPSMKENTPSEIKEMILQAGITLLIDQPITIDGINFFGTPYTPPFMNWAFMADDLKMQKTFEKIPENTHVLISHGPPKDILDWCPGGHVGSEVHEQYLCKHPTIRLNIFGHIHESAGTLKKEDILYVNASCLDGNYRGFNPIWVVDTDTWTAKSFPQQPEFRRDYRS